MLLLLACTPSTIDTAKPGDTGSPPVDTVDTQDTVDTENTVDTHDTVDTQDTVDTHDTVDTGPVDADGDGYTTVDDCDDTLASVHPGAYEICDGLDGDCDGAVDEGAMLPWYADADGDGYGDGAVIAWACTAPPGYVGADDDCDDGDALTNPGMKEVCDEQDNNCNGRADEGLADTFYLDADADGYGVDSTTVSDCAAPAGYTTIAGDCDDAAGDVNPGATEVCDGVDHDCDGYATDHCGGLGPLTDTTAANVTVDGILGSWAGVGDLDGDGAVDLVLGYAYGSELGYVNTFSTVVDGDLRTRADAVTSAVAAEEEFGKVGRLLGDIDGVTGDDVAVTSATGAALLGWPLPGFSTDALTTFDAGDDFASPDLDGDGAVDLVIGAAGVHNSVATAGAYVFPTPLATGTYALAADAAASVTSADTTELGFQVRDVGDLDGDGLADLAIAARTADLGGAGASGAVFLFAGPLVGSFDAGLDADTTVTSTAISSNFGGVIAGANDMDGDGYADLVAGSVRYVLVVPGPLPAGAIDETSAVATVAPPSSGDVDAACDLDLDGKSDLVATYSSGSRVSTGYVWYGDLTGALDETAVDTRIYAWGYYDAFGTQVRGAFDFDGDGFDDLTITDPDTGVGGSVYLFAGR